MPQTPSTIGQTNEQKLSAHLPNIYDPKDRECHLFILERLEKARIQRDTPCRFFDDMSYVDDYLANENAKNSYLRKKRNDSEVRVVTGVTEKKIEAIYNELLALNLHHEVRCFDYDDKELKELGDDLGDLITRTNRIEEDEDFLQDAVLELLTQRALFVRERFVTKKTRNGKATIAMAKKELISGLKIYLGDITIPAYRFNEQPYIVEYNRVHWRILEEIWGDNPNWKYVRKGAGALDPNAKFTSFSYRFGRLEEDEMECIYYESLPDNEYQVLINGVPMLLPKSPLPYSGNEYQVKMITLKSMSTDFAYGKPLTASAKTLQALTDESIRLMIRKFQQSLEPPLASKKKIYSKDIWNPGSVVQNADPKDFSALITHQGVTQSEFEMYRLIEEKAQEFIGASNVQQGLPSGKEMSATEILETQRQATKQLGLSVAAVSRLIREMSKARIYTIFDEYLKPVGRRVNPLSKEAEEIYRGFTVSDVMLENERKGTKRLQFMNRDLTDEELGGIYEYEKEQESIGNHIRLKGINVNKLKDLNLYFYISVTPMQKEGSALDKVMFQDRIAQGTQVSQISGRPMNGDKIIDDFERTWRAKDWFQKAAPSSLPIGNDSGAVGMEAEGMMKELDAMSSKQGSEMRQGMVGGRTQQPSLNTVINST
jgi:hypothetical protein